MITVQEVRKLALSLEATEELPHFEKTSFRVKKKIFATMDEKKQLVCLMLNPKEQNVFCSINKEIIYPVPNKWGLKGATYVELKKVRKDLFRDALTVSYCCVAPKALAEKYSTA